MGPTGILTPWHFPAASGALGATFLKHVRQARVRSLGIRIGKTQSGMGRVASKTKILPSYRDELSQGKADAETVRSAGAKHLVQF